MKLTTFNFQILSVSLRMTQSTDLLNLNGYYMIIKENMIDYQF